MDSPTAAPPAPAAGSSSKLRLMCSYGGQIAPRSHSKSLFYSGGDTRIVSIPATAASTLSSFASAVSSALSVPFPFTLKYQLPGHDLDSLVSICSDDDLFALLDELPRLPPPSRIRLFIFPPKPSSSALCHPKTETWFVDALNSARMMQKAETCSPGYGQNETFTPVGGHGMLSGAESIVLETNSSFGSTSSSASLTNFPSGRPHDDDIGTYFPENRARFPVADSAPSDARGTYYEHVAKVATFETRASPSAALEPESIGIPFSSFTPFPQTVPVSGYPIQPLPRLVPAGTMYLPQQHQSVSLLSGPPSQPVYHLQPSLYQPPNASYPIYPLPSNQTPAQSYGISVPCGLADPTGHLHSTIPPMPSSYEAGDAPDPALLSNSNPSQHAGLHQVQHLIQPVDLEHRETLSPRSEFDDDLDRVQIYKSQPPLPTLPSHYQTMTKTTTLLLSEAFAQLHTDGIRQPMDPSQLP